MLQNTNVLCVRLCIWKFWVEEMKREKEQLEEEKMYKV